MADGFRTVGKKRSGNSWQCTKCARADPNDPNRWQNPGRTCCFKDNCDGVKPKTPKLYSSSAEWKAAHGTAGASPSPKPKAKAKAKQQQPDALQQAQAEIKQLREQLKGKGAAADEEEHAEPDAPALAKAVQTAEQELQKLDSLFGARALAGPAGEQHLIDERAFRLRNIEAAKAAVQAAKTEAAKSKDPSKAYDQANGKAKRLRKKRDAAIASMQACHAEQKALDERYEAHLVEYGRLEEEVRAAEAEVEAARIKTAAGGGDAGVLATMRAFYEATSTATAGLPQHAEIMAAFQVSSNMLTSILASKKQAETVAATLAPAAATEAGAVELEVVPQLGRPLPPALDGAAPAPAAAGAGGAPAAAAPAASASAAAAPTAPAAAAPAAATAAGKSGGAKGGGKGGAKGSTTKPEAVDVATLVQGGRAAKQRRAGAVPADAPDAGMDNEDL